MPIRPHHVPLLVILLSMPAIALAGNTAQEIQRTRALAKPVLTQGAPDSALLAHLRAVHEQQPTSDIMELILIVMKEALVDQEIEQKYWLKKLKERNAINEALHDYMEELARASAELNKKVRSSSDDSSFLNRIDNALRRFEAVLRQSRGLNSGDQRALNAIVVRNRRFISASRRLLTQAHAISLSPRRLSPHRPTPTKQPTLRRPVPPNENLRVPPR
jgi:hypothetical protein